MRWKTSRRPTQRLIRGAPAIFGLNLGHESFKELHVRRITGNPARVVVPLADIPAMDDLLDEMAREDDGRDSLLEQVRCLEFYDDEGGRLD